MAPLFAFGPGIAEELVFRGAFQRSIRRGWLAVLLSGTLFAVYHTDPQHIVAVLPLGFYLAWLAQRTDSTLVSMTAHIANNGAAVIAANLGESEELTHGLSTMEDVWLVPVGLLVAAVVVGIVWRVTQPQAPRRASAPAELIDEPSSPAHGMTPDPVGADPVGADPVGADPVGADPVGADPVAADPVDDLGQRF